MQDLAVGFVPIFLVTRALIGDLLQVTTFLILSVPSLLRQ
jgi:hypothetical protein